jgi:hypothetical protein
MIMNSSDSDPRKTALPSPAPGVNYRSDLSAERGLHINKHSSVKKNYLKRKKNLSRVPDGCLTPRETERLRLLPY